MGVEHAHELLAPRIRLEAHRQPLLGGEGIGERGTRGRVAQGAHPPGAFAGSMEDHSAAFQRVAGLEVLDDFAADRLRPAWISPRIH